MTPWPPVCKCRFRRHLDALDYRVQRQDIGLVADTDAEAVNNRQSQRQAQSDRRLNSEATVDRHRTAQRFDIATNDIHADAAAGQIRDYFRGGEARLENEPKEVWVR